MRTFSLYRHCQPVSRTSGDNLRSFCYRTRETELFSAFARSGSGKYTHFSGSFRKNLLRGGGKHGMIKNGDRDAETTSPPESADCERGRSCSAELPVRARTSNGVAWNTRGAVRESFRGGAIRCFTLFSRRRPVEHSNRLLFFRNAPGLESTLYVQIPFRG